ncbi:hypothetical protein GX408_09180 [bacterium]|nr:hypothetical protein [bacterium]
MTVLIRKYFSCAPLLLFGLLLAAGLSLPPDILSHFFSDDSFFYLKIAQNLSLGKGSTFDGLNPTNGYHPLYLAWLSLLAVLTTLRPMQGMYIVWLNDGLLFLIFLLLLHRFLEENQLSSAGRWTVLMLCLTFLGLYDFGNEGRLLMPLAWWLVIRVQQQWSTPTGPLWPLGVLSALVLLCRLDAVLLPLCLLLPLFLRQIRFAGTMSARLREGLLLFGPLVVTALAFAFSNQWRYSSPFTVSSYIKFGWPGTFATRWLLTAGISLKARFFFCLISATATALWLRRKKARAAQASFLHVLCSLTVYVLFYSLILVLGGLGEIRFWYFVLPLVISFLVWGVWLDRRVQRRPVLTQALRTAMMVVLLLGLFAAMVHKKITWSGRRDCWALAQWIKVNTPPDTRIFQVDGSGVIGYFSERAVINGDGLVNSWDYQRALQQGQLRAFLQSCKVDYLVWNRYLEGEKIEIRIPLKNHRGYVLGFAGAPELRARFGAYVLIRWDETMVTITPAPV